MPGGKGLELCDDFGVAAERDLSFDSLFERAQAQVLKSRDLFLGKRLVRKIGQGGAAPKRKRLVDLLSRRSGLSAGEGSAAIVEQALERVSVELTRFDPEDVAVPARLERRFFVLRSTVRVDRSAKARDVSLERLRGRGRRSLPPELVDQLVGGDDLVRVEEEDGEERTLLATAELDPPTLVGDLQRTQDPEIHLACCTLRRQVEPLIRSGPATNFDRPATEPQPPPATLVGPTHGVKGGHAMRNVFVTGVAVVAFAAITAPVAAPQAKPRPNENASCVAHVGTPAGVRAEERGPLGFPFGEIVSHFAVDHEGGSAEECFIEQNGGQ